MGPVALGQGKTRATTVKRDLMVGIEIASLFTSVGADTSNFDRAMSHTGGIIVSTGNSLKGLGLLGIGLATKGFDIASASVQDFVHGASDLSETINKSTVLFGRNITDSWFSFNN